MCMYGCVCIYIYIYIYIYCLVTARSKHPLRSDPELLLPRNLSPLIPYII